MDVARRLLSIWNLSRTTRLAREGGWLTAGEVGSIVGRLVGIRLLTTVLVPATYGEIALLLGTAGIGIGVLFSPLFIAGQRFYADAAQAGHAAALRSALSTTLNGLLAATTVLILIGGLAWTSAHESSSYWPFVALVPVVALEARRLFATTQLNAARRQAENSAWLTLDAWCKPLGAVLFVVAFGKSATAAIAGYAAGSALPFFILRSGARSDGLAPDTGTDDAEARKALIRSALRYALPLAPLAVLRSIGSVSDRYILAAIGGAEATGVYVAAYGIGSAPFLALGRVALATFRPALFEAVAQGNAAKARLLFAGWLTVVTAAAVAGAVLISWQAELITSLVLGTHFQSSASLLPWIVAGYVALAIQQVFEGAIHAQRRAHMLTIVQAVTAVIAVILYVWMIRTTGALGAARATFLVFALSCSLTIAFARVSSLLRRSDAAT